MIYPAGSEELTWGNLWMPDMVRLALAVGDTETARGATQALESLLLRTTRSPFSAASSLHCRGLLEDDAKLVLDAADGYRSIPFPLGQAQAL
jgi:hypothetical protein